MVVACVALTAALAQTSYAAVSTLIAHNSVGTPQLKNNAVTSDKVRDFTLRSWDFKRNDLPRGAAGPAGPAGPPGPPGTIGDLTLRESSVAVPGNAAGNGLYVTRSVQVSCQAGEKAITGGTSWSTDENEEELMTVYSRPVLENAKSVGWRARGGTDIASDRVFTVKVLCAKG
jgi:hypothetical protein